MRTKGRKSGTTDEETFEEAGMKSERAKERTRTKRKEIRNCR